MFAVERVRRDFPILNVEAHPGVPLVYLDNAASSQKSLGIMLLIAAIGVPLVASYTFFVYRTFSGKVQIDETSY